MPVTPRRTSAPTTGGTAPNAPTEADARAFCARMMAALTAAGLPRTSRLSGGELTGLTTSFGSTGFSVRVVRPGDDAPGSFCGRVPPRVGDLDVHLVVSGKAAGLRYYEGTGDDGHEPVAPDRLCPRIQDVLTALGCRVREVRCSGWQCMWDDDVCYNALIEGPLPAA